ncbi:TPA: hypothetical protein ACISUQ_003520, partial [Salmonella enterica subsp. enterica serovar Javiana]
LNLCVLSRPDLTHSFERLRVTGFDIVSNPYIKHEVIFMLHTTNPVSKLSKSQQYRVAYNLPVLFKVPHLMNPACARDGSSGALRVD